MNKNSTEYSDRGKHGLGALSLAYVKSLQAFPTGITDNIFTSIFASGILSNTLLLAYIIYCKRYKSPVFCVILSLGVADLGTCLAGVLFYNFTTPFIQGPLWLCPVTNLLLGLSYISSAYHIAVFAVLRFLQLVYPLTSHAKVTTGLMFKVCLTIWSFHFIQSIGFSFYIEAYNISTTGSSDLYMCLYTGNRQARSLLNIIICVLVPFLTTSGVHVAKHIILVLRPSATVTSLDEQVQQVRRQPDSRALAIVIVVYLVTVLPYLVQDFRIHVFYVTDNPIEVYLVKVFIQVAYSNSAIDPWIYLFAAKSVRSEIRKMLACNRKNREDIK